MTLRPRNVFLASLAVWAIFLSAQFAAGKKQKQLPTPIDQHAQVLHALNRLTFGPRPGDVEHVSAMGLQNWIEQQLHPEKIEDRSLEARLIPFAYNNELRGTLEAIRPTVQQHLDRARALLRRPKQPFTGARTCRSRRRGRLGR